MMQNLLKTVAFIIAATLLFSACKKKENKVTVPYNPYEGSWRMVSHTIYREDVLDTIIPINSSEPIIYTFGVCDLNGSGSGNATTDANALVQGNFTYDFEPNSNRIRLTTGRNFDFIVVYHTNTMLEMHTTIYASLFPEIGTAYKSQYQFVAE